MITGIWGRKIGMTQVFVEDQVVPVTAIDMANWIVTNVRTDEKDGYHAVQVGYLRDRYVAQQFSPEWLKDLKKYFRYVREIRSPKVVENITIGQPVDFYTMLAQGNKVDVIGITKGRGFAGVVKRHDFTGAKASHGSKMGKRPGSSSSYRSQGRIIKGKRFPGHMGTLTRMMKQLDVVKVEPDAKIVLVKGSIPGHAGSLVFVRKV